VQLHFLLILEQETERVLAWMGRIGAAHGSSYSRGLSQLTLRFCRCVVDGSGSGFFERSDPDPHIKYPDPQYCNFVCENRKAWQSKLHRQNFAEFCGTIRNSATWNSIYFRGIFANSVPVSAPHTECTGLKKRYRYRIPCWRNSVNTLILMKFRLKVYKIHTGTGNITGT
jgi:hypothetical protein